MISLVYINRGRWVVDCPGEECAWAYRAMTDASVPRPRYQLRCDGGPDMFGHGVNTGCGTRIELAWPPLDACLEIERILFARSQALARNWRPPETVEGLSAENEQLLVGWNIERLAEAGIGVV